MAQYFNRPPRIQPFELPTGEIQIPNPPSPSFGGGRLGMVTMVLPLVTILGYSLVSGRTSNILFILPMGLAAILMGAVAYLNWRRSRDNEEAKQQRYLKLLERLSDRIGKAHKTQQDFYNHNFPSPTTLMQIASNQNPRLWERRPEDADFGTLRMGVGRTPSTVILKPPSGEDTSAPHFLAAQTLAERSAYLPDAPIGLPLRAVQAVGIHGRDYSLITDFSRSLLVQLGALHAPNEVRLYIIGTPEARRQWEWAKWLPHAVSSRRDQSLSDQLCFDSKQSPAFWASVQAELERRQARLQADSKSNVTLPWLLVLVDMASPQAQTSPLEDVSAEAALSMLFSVGNKLGASVVFLVGDSRIIPGDCNAVVTVDASGSDAFFRYAETGVNSGRSDGVVDRVDVAHADEFARKLAPLAIRTTYGGDLPSSLTLFDLMHVTTVEELRLLENWRQSRENGVIWPEVSMGATLGNKPLHLVFEQNEGTGVHGLVAGTTGTGKSQLLMTMIVGLAVRYDPTTVNFVLVDYKGGTTFEAFRSLPHTVDVITNLHGQAGTRAFTAIRAELNRRTTILKDAHVQDIGQYHKRGEHLKKPLSHLFVIIDEFAEMIKDRPEFRTQLEGIARLGRALGVHLILATQRPGGLVSDQIRSNMKFRLCLRVETPEDSRELLGRADAAFLPQNVPGRAYLQVGNDAVQLFQVAQVGSVYQGPRVDKQPAVIWLNRSGISGGPVAPVSGNETLTDVVIATASQLVREHDLERPQRPWPDALPLTLTLAEHVPALRDWLEGQEGKWRGVSWSAESAGLQAMAVPIGLLDNPAQAEQIPLVLDFQRGHVIVFGASGWGKSTLLRSVIAGLVSTHSPAELNIYILDCGGRGLDVFQTLPHLGHYITPAESERVQRLFRRLANILDTRKTLFSQAQVSSLGEYNTRRPEVAEPAILFLLDNFAEFRESFPDEMETFAGLARDGRAYGLHILISAEQVMTIPPKIYSLFTERLALRLADNTEYSGIVGRGVVDAPEIPGRGFIRRERTPLEFQVAAPGRLPGESLRDLARQTESTEPDVDENRRLVALSESMRMEWTGSRPDPIEVLEQVVGLDRLLAQASTRQMLPPLGVQDSDLKPALVDLRLQGPHFVITGPPLSGKTTALRTLMLALADRYSPEKVSLVLIDFQQRFFRYGGANTLTDLPHVLDAISDTAELDGLIDRVRSVYVGDERTNREMYVLIDNYDDFSAAVSTIRTPPTPISRLAELARLHGASGLHFVVSVSTNLQRFNDDFIRQVQANRFGIGLDANESPGMLGARMRSGPNVEFPPGRGYLVKSGRASLIQVATPQMELKSIDESLDIWVENICERYPEQAAWPELPEVE